MTKLEHTKEPWRLCPHTLNIMAPEIGGCNMEEQDMMVAQPRGWGCLSYHGGGYALEKQRANSERIVACVNALAGIKNPEAIKGVIEALERMLGEFAPVSNNTAAIRAREALASLSELSPEGEAVGTSK